MIISKLSDCQSLVGISIVNYSSFSTFLRICQVRTHWWQKQKGTNNFSTNFSMTSQEKCGYTEFDFCVKAYLPGGISLGISFTAARKKKWLKINHMCSFYNCFRHLAKCGGFFNLKKIYFLRNWLAWVWVPVLWIFFMI